MIGYVAECCASVNLQYPLGGEVLPQNGKHLIVWTNSTNETVEIIVDKYMDEAVYLESSLLKTIACTEATNSLLWLPVNYPTDMPYKVRVVGTNDQSQSGFVFVTSPASYDWSIDDTNPWSPSQVKTVCVSWEGFQSNDVHKVILEAPLLDKAGYGFLMTNFVVSTSSGTQYFSFNYPSDSTAAYPPESFGLISGIHSFTIINERCGIVQTFGAIDLLTSGLGMSIVAGEQTNVTRGAVNISAKVKLDASLATNDVVVSSVNVVFTSYSSNWVAMDCILSNQTSQSSVVTLSFNPQTNQTYDTLVSFPINVTIPQGQIKSYSIVCSVKPECGTGSFIWNTQNGVSNIFATVVAEYEGGGEIDITTTKSSGSFVVIEDVVQPRFISSSRQDNFVIYDVLCRAGAPYLVLSSQDLENWSGFYTTNGYNGLIRLTIPVQVGNHFFRLLETNSVPIAMPEGDLLENTFQSRSLETSSLVVSSEYSKLMREELRAKILRKCGTFWSSSHPEWPPLPINIHDIPTTNISGRVYLLDIGIRK
jgi:hypothetical protein